MPVACQLPPYLSLSALSSFLQSYSNLPSMSQSYLEFCFCCINYSTVSLWLLVSSNLCLYLLTLGYVTLICIFLPFYLPSSLSITICFTHFLFFSILSSPAFSFFLFLVSPHFSSFFFRNYQLYSQTNYPYSFIYKKIFCTSSVSVCLSKLHIPNLFLLFSLVSRLCLLFHRFHFTPIPPIPPSSHLLPLPISVTQMACTTQPAWHFKVPWIGWKTIPLVYAAASVMKIVRAVGSGAESKWILAFPLRWTCRCGSTATGTPFPHWTVYTEWLFRVQSISCNGLHYKSTRPQGEDKRLWIILKFNQLFQGIIQRPPTRWIISMIWIILL